jgi:hypothetical protein
VYKEKFYVTTSNASVYKFFGDFTFDKDAEDCMGTGTLKKTLKFPFRTMGGD